VFLEECERGEEEEENLEAEEGAERGGG